MVGIRWSLAGKSDIQIWSTWPTCVRTPADLIVSLGWLHRGNPVFGFASKQQTSMLKGCRHSWTWNLWRLARKRSSPPAPWHHQPVSREAWVSRSVFNFLRFPWLGGCLENVCFSSQRNPGFHNPYIEEVDRPSKRVWEESPEFRETKGLDHRKYLLCLFVLAEEEERHRKALAGGVGGVTE